MARKRAVLDVAANVYGLTAATGAKRAKYGAAKAIMSNAFAIYPWITRDLVNFQVQKMKNGSTPQPVLITTASTEQQPAVPVTTVRGRPTGTTVAAIRSLDKRKEKALNDVVYNYNCLKVQAQRRGDQRIGNNVLDVIIPTTLRNSNLDKEAPEFLISHNTVRACITRHRDLSKSKTGTLSSMTAVEPFLVDLYLKKARMGQPMGMSEGLAFANSLIEGTELEEKVIQYKERFKILKGKSRWVRSIGATF